MTRTIPDDLTDKVVKLLGLLSSHHDGEVANAGRMADRLIRTYGLTWGDLICALEVEETPTESIRHQPPRDVAAPMSAEQARHHAWALWEDHHGELSETAADFLANMSETLRAPTAKQAKYLRDLVEKFTGVRP